MTDQIEIEFMGYDGSLVELLIPVDRCVPLTGAAKGGVAWYGDSRSSLSPEDHKALVGDELAAVHARQAQLREEMTDFLLEHADPEWLEQLANEAIPTPIDHLHGLDSITPWEVDP